MTHPYARLFFGLSGPTVTEDSDSNYEIGDIWIVPGVARYQAIDVSPGAAVWQTGGGGAPSWGDILGTLSDQTDLQSALDGKLDDSQLEDTIANGVTNKAPSQNAVFDALALKEDLSNKDTDGTLAANSDLKYPSQKAVKTYADTLIAANDALQYKGVIDASANPNYPAASAGHAYKISVAGKIGGASGPNVEVGDLILCLVDGSASGNHATVGANWDIIQVNIDGAVIGPASSTSANLATFSGTSGKLIQDSGVALSGLQPIDADLTAISGLTPSNDDILQRKAGAWSNRTLAQLKSDLALAILDMVDVNLTDLADETLLLWIQDDVEFQFYPKSFLAQANHGHFNDGEGNPADPASASADGTSTYAARRDHVHKGPSKAIMLFVTHALTSTIAAGATNYLCPFVDGAPSLTERAMVVTRNATVKNFYVRQVGNQPAGGSLQCYVRRATTTDEILITIAALAAGPATRSNTATSFAISAGDFIGFKFVNNAPANPSATIGFVAVEVEFDP